MVVPIIAPLDPGSNAYAQTSASTYSVSETTAGVEWSGTAMVTTQTMSLDIYRQPRITPTDYSRSGLLLSGTPTGLQDILYTELRIKVTAAVDRTITSGTFAGSAVFTPQEFQVVRQNKDIKGNTYEHSSGASATSGSPGAQCTVISTIGAMRVPWLSGYGGEYSESVQDVLTFSEVCSIGYPSIRMQNNRMWGDWSLDQDDRYAWVQCQPGPIWGWMGGQYDPSNENSGDLRNLIHNLALHLKNKGFFDGLIPAQLRSVPSYDRNWHKYGS